MNDDQATELFTRLGAGIPEERPAAAELISIGRRGRRRRTTRTILAAAVAVLVVTGGGAVAVGVADGHRGTSVVADGPSGLPAPAPGYKYVGRGRVVVQVPEDAHLFTTSCGISGPGYFLNALQEERCFQLSRTERGLTVGFLLQSQNPDPISSCSSQDCREIAGVGQIQVLMSGTRAEVDRLRSSIAVLPDGYTTVPLIVGESPAAAAEATAAVGLPLTTAANSMPRLHVRSQEPAAGSIVKSGSVVTATAKTNATILITTDELEGAWSPLRVGGKTVRAQGSDLLRFGATTVTAPTRCRRATARYTLRPGGGFHVGSLQNLLDCRRLGVDSASLLAHAARLSIALTVIGKRHVLVEELVLLDADGREIAAYRSRQNLVRLATSK